MWHRKFKRQSRVLEREKKDWLGMAVFTFLFIFPLFSLRDRVFIVGAQELVDFVWVPVLKRVGIFKAPSWQHEVSVIVAHPWVQTHFLPRKTLLLKKYSLPPTPRVLLVASVRPWARTRGEAVPRETGVRSWKRENKLCLASGNQLPAWKKGGKRGFAASQPFTGGRGLEAAPQVGRGWDAQPCGLSLFAQMSLFWKKKN